MADKKVTISGFSMCRNADSLYYPVKESIESVLPIVDEFVDHKLDQQALLAEANHM